MSPLIEVPAELIMVLSLAAAAVGGEASRAPDAHDMRAPAIERRTFQDDNGPFRLGEQIWLRAMSERCEEPRFQLYACRIFVTSSGRYYVPRRQERRELLSLRRDPVVAEYVTERFAQDNARRIAGALGRPASAGELYIAHLAGPEATIEMVTLLDRRPEANLAHRLPHAAMALDAVHPGGAALSIAAAYVALVRAVDPRDARADAIARRTERGSTAGAIARPAGPRRGTAASGGARDGPAMSLAGLAWRTSMQAGSPAR